MRYFGSFALLALIGSSAVAQETRPAAPVTSEEGIATFYKAPAPTGGKDVTALARIKKPVDCVPKEYPVTARFYEQQGSVLLYFLLDIDGKVIEAKVGQSSGFPLLDDAALAAFSAPTCEFQPILANGVPVKTWAKIKYTWKLN